MDLINKQAYISPVADDGFSTDAPILLMSLLLRSCPYLVLTVSLASAAGIIHTYFIFKYLWYLLKIRIYGLHVKRVEMLALQLKTLL